MVIHYSVFGIIGTIPVSIHFLSLITHGWSHTGLLSTYHQWNNRQGNPRNNELFISNVIGPAMIWTTRSFTWTVDKKTTSIHIHFLRDLPTNLKFEWNYVAKATSKYRMCNRTTPNECNFLSWITNDE
jgi:hypothetical protein